jgi:hypothetical protein
MPGLIPLVDPATTADLLFMGIRDAPRASSQCYVGRRAGLRDYPMGNH